MEVINVSANPPIKVVSRITRSLNHWSTNTYIDPIDEVAFFVEDLDATELGHVYHWKDTVDQWVLIHMPYKVMDNATGRLIKGLKSFKSCKPYVNGVLPERHLKNPKSCIQTFRLNREDFNTFSRRVSSIKGVLEKDEVNVEELSCQIHELQLSLERFIRTLNEYRSKVSLSQSPKYYETTDDLPTVLSTYKNFRNSKEEISEFAVKIVLSMDKLSKETGRETDKVRINEEFSGVKKTLSEVRALPIDRYEREAIHKSRVDLGTESESEIPLHIRDLALEIGELKAYYPCLGRLRVVSNDEIAIDLTGVDVSISSTKVVVRGDPGALNAYMGENSTAEGDVGGRRSRRIVGARDREK